MRVYAIALIVMLTARPAWALSSLKANTKGPCKNVNP